MSFVRDISGLIKRNHVLFIVISITLAILIIAWRVYYKRLTDSNITEEQRKKKLPLIDFVIAVLNALVLPLLISVITMDGDSIAYQMELQTMYNDACAYMDDGEYAKALHQWENLLKEDPDNARYHNKMGDTYFYMGDYENAFSEFTYASNIEINAEHMFDMGRTKYMLGEYEQASSLYEKAIEEEADNASYYYGNGLAYYKLEKYEDACINYEEALKLYKKKDLIARTYKEYGMARFRQDNLDEALRLFHKAVDNDLDNVEYPKYVTMIQSRLQVEENLMDAVAHNRYGNSLFNLRLYDDAIKEYQKAIQLDSVNTVYYSNTANAYYQMKDYDSAESILVEGLNVSEDDARCLKMRERIRIVRMMQDNDRNLDLSFKYLRVSIELLDMNVARQEAKKIRDIDPRNSDVDKYLSLIDSYYATADDASNWEVKYDLASRYYELGFFELAKVEFEKLVRLNADNAGYQNYYGCALYELGEYQDALVAFEKASELEPDNESYKQNADLAKAMLQ